MGISIIILVRLNEILIQSGKTVSLPEGISGIVETFDITIREGVAGNKGPL